MNSNCVTFLKTNEVFGGLSNMSGEYPISVNGVRILTSEHFYQALKFPNHPEIQKAILNKPSPIACKWIANKKEYRSLVQPGWKEVQLEVMEFCLRTKFVWHWVKFGNLLRATAGKTIFEISSKGNRYWGVTACDDGFVGENHLGRLLMKLRDELLGESNEHLRCVAAPGHIGLRFLGEEIEVMDRRQHLCQEGTRSTDRVNAVRP